MVTDISKVRLILLFTEGLAEPLKGLVKAYQPSTLQEAMRRTRDLQDSIPKTKYPPKDTMHNKFYNERPPMRNFTSPIKKYYSYKDQDKLRMKKL